MKALKKQFRIVGILLTVMSIGLVILASVPTEAQTRSGNVRPILECVRNNNNGTYTAFFGYSNDTGTVASIPVGGNNRFNPAPENRGQPTEFQPGRVVAAFSIDFVSGTLVWSLQGPNGVRRTATAGTGSSACSVPTPTPTPVPNSPPIANAGSDVSTIANTREGVIRVRLDASASYDADGTITSYQWSNGMSGAVITPTVPVGVHTFTVTITDNHGDTAQDTVTVTVRHNTNQPPVAYAGEDIMLQFEPNTVRPPSISFNASQSYDPDGVIVSYVWRLDGNIISTGTTVDLDVNIGYYVLELTVTDEDGASASDTVTVQVLESDIFTPGDGVSFRR